MHGRVRGRRGPRGRRAGWRRVKRKSTEDGRSVAAYAHAERAHACVGIPDRAWPRAAGVTRAELSEARLFEVVSGLPPS